jgi:hypothetical protein
MLGRDFVVKMLGEASLVGMKVWWGAWSSLLGEGKPQNLQAQGGITHDSGSPGMSKLSKDKAINFESQAVGVGTLVVQALGLLWFWGRAWGLPNS